MNERNLHQNQNHPKQLSAKVNAPRENRLNRANQLSVSIGIPAYNEEQNIKKLLDAVFRQDLNHVIISEIIVIASGCTDRTVEIVQKIQAEQNASPGQNRHLQTASGHTAGTQTDSPVLRLIIQPERTGKSSAVNLFIKESKEDVLVLESADTIPVPGTIEHLCAPFLNMQIGLAGAHPVPTNSAKTFAGFCVKTMWEMHHQIALKNPKCGELIAFRKALPATGSTPETGGAAAKNVTVITGIPAQSAVDEASIEAEILKHHLKIIYVPEAIVQNKGPETIGEFIAQRRRINAGHIWLQKNFSHKISTNNKMSVLSLTLARFNLNPKNDLWLIGMMLIEAWSKVLGRYDYYFKKKKHIVWERISTTKNPQINAK